MELKERLVKKSHFTPKNTAGFTLLEVTLFLAISAALVVIAIVGLGPRLTNVRFSSSMRSLKNSVDKEFTSSSAGLNFNNSGYTCSATNYFNRLNIVKLESGGGQGANGSCVLVGRVAVAEKAPVNAVTYRSIVAAAEPITNVSQCSTQTQRESFDGLRRCYQAAILDDQFEPPRIYTYSNGLQQVSDTRAFGFVRSPASSVQYRFSAVKKSQYGEAITYNNTALNDARLTYNQINSVETDEFPMCFSLGSRQASLVFSNKSTEPRLIFNEACV